MAQNTENNKDALAGLPIFFTSQSETGRRSGIKNQTGRLWWLSCLPGLGLALDYLPFDGADFVRWEQRASLHGLPETGQVHAQQFPVSVLRVRHDGPRVVFSPIDRIP